MSHGERSVAFEPTESGAPRNMKKSPAKTHKNRRPSKASLAEIPEIDFSKVRVRKNPYAARLAKEGFVVQVGRGRPRKVEEVGLGDRLAPIPSLVKS